MGDVNTMPKKTTARPAFVPAARLRPAQRIVTARRGGPETVRSVEPASVDEPMITIHTEEGTLIYACPTASFEVMAS